MNEEWKTLKINEKYEVSNLGRVRYKKLQRVLKPIKHSAGYRTVRLTFENRIQKGYYIHRLVATEFIENPNNKEEVNHINGKKDDNRVENLEWVTPQENCIHARDTGLFIDKLDRWNTILDYEKVKEIIELLKSGITQYEISKIYGVSNITISDIARGITWTEIKRERMICPHAKKKLNKTDILKIKELYTTGLYNQTEIGKMFDVTRGTISKIVNNKY